jgi:hypothetical protein
MVDQSQHLIILSVFQIQSRERSTHNEMRKQSFKGRGNFTFWSLCPNLAIPTANVDSETTPYSERLTFVAINITVSLLLEALPVSFLLRFPTIVGSPH